jgi:hypothetical protein
MKLAPAVVLVASLASHADANPASAWTAAKANLSGAPAFVGGVKVSDVARLNVVQMLLSMGAPDVKKGLEQLQRVCGLDAWKTIEAVAWGLDADFHGVAFVAVKGLDQAKVATCAEGLARDGGDKDAKATSTVNGAITTLVVGGETTYLRWIGKDVIAVATDPADRALLEKWTKKGGLARTKVGKLAAKADTKAMVWAASTLEKDVDGGKVQHAYGSIALRGGVLDGSVRVGFDSAANAKAAADKLHADLAADDDGKALLAKVSVAADGAEVVVKGKLTESEVMQAAGSLR